MQRIFIFMSFTIGVLIKSQVGINSSSPRATLDVVGKPAVTSVLDGVIAPRITGDQLNNKTYTIAQEGAIVYVTSPDSSPSGQTINVTSRGYYYFDGPSLQWLQLAVQESEFRLSDVLADVATGPVDAPAGTINNIDLGLSLVVTIPANSTAKILMSYSVPMGTYPIGATVVGSDPNGKVSGYFGIRFLKNGIEEQGGSRKYSVPFANAATHMMSVAGSFTEEIVNNTASDTTVTYTLNGYVEATVTQTRFNMWDAVGSNFNWGKGSLSATVFTKDN